MRIYSGAALSGDPGEVYVLSAPTGWITTRPGAETQSESMYWAGGVRWSPNICDACLFQSEAAAKAHADAMNLREWTVTALALPRK